MIQGDDAEIRARTLAARAPNVDTIVLEIDHYTFILEFVGCEYSFRAAHRIDHDRQCCGAERQIADGKGVDPYGWHYRNSRDTAQQDGRRLIERDVESLGHVGSHPGARRAGVEHQAKRPAAVNPHRSPDSPDAIAQCGC